MEYIYVEKTCQYCGTLFKTIRADAKFCCKEHRIKAHRLPKTHVRMIALTLAELESLRLRFFNLKYIEVKFRNIFFTNREFKNVVVFYVAKKNYKQIFNLSDDSEIPHTPICMDSVTYYFEDLRALDNID